MRTELPDPSMKELTHRDEIHGDVAYDALAVALLNTPTLQRLGRVYQLGYGHLVYRGGTHTRLSHSMGTYATAGRLVDALRRNYESRALPPEGAVPAAEFLPSRSPAARPDQPLTLDVDDSDTSLAATLGARWSVLRHLVGWAALLHDIGHVPLGHTLEDEFEGIYQKHDGFSSPRLEHLWLGAPDGTESEVGRILRETRLYPESFRRAGVTDGDDVWATVFLICTWKEHIQAGARLTFEEILAAEIEKLGSEGKDHAVASRLLDVTTRLTPDLFSPYMADIVANTISADYLDYLRRDPRNLGLDVLNDDRVVSRFWVGRDHRDQLRMALSLVDRRGKPRLDTCTGVVDLVRQRYRFAEIVYYHKTKVSASAMLAKVFHLIGAPPETPSIREIPALGEAEGVADALLDDERTRATRLQELREDFLPSSLLDTEVGDESLGLLLRERAWQQLNDAVGGGKRDLAVRAVQSITLLDAIARRALYKVAFMMDAHHFQQLSARRNSPKEDVERALTELIERLRQSGAARATVEEAMVQAAGWPANALLLYVPPRKSQAKGIQTGALMDGRVVTLGDHPAVKKAVEDLSEHYADLWRLIILVHPRYASDAIGLSHAVDAFCESELSSDIDLLPVVDALHNCSWFAYQRPDDREAASLFRELHGDRGETVNWLALAEYEKISPGRKTDEQLAYGASLLERLVRRGDPETAAQVISDAGDAASIAERVATEREKVLATASREGERDATDEVRATQAALDAIADALMR